MDTKLVNLRIRINVIDKAIIHLIGKRMEIVRHIGKYKKKHDILPFDSKRWEKVLRSAVNEGIQNRLSKKLTVGIYKAIHREALQIEQNI